MTAWTRRRPGLTAATRLQGEPPPLGYYATRIKLGMPSGADALVRGCPWCGAAIFEPCQIRGKRRPPHEARQAPP
jgi:hypothetical protein